MAHLERDEASGLWRIRFRFGGRPFKRSLKTADRPEAESVLKRVEATLADLALGRLQVPAKAEVGRFIISDGRMTAKPDLPAVLTVEKLFTLYEELLPAGALEDTSLVTLGTHKRHF